MTSPSTNPWAPALVAVAVALAASAGCASQAPTTYEGEPLALIRGTVQTTSAKALATPIEAAIFWQKVRFGQGETELANQGNLSTPTPIAGSFPAEFRLKILVPPDDRALVPCFGDQPGGLAWGSSVAVRKGADPSNTKLTDLHGYAADAAVVYASAPIPPDAPCNSMFRTEISPGYHLFVRRHVSDEEQAAADAAAEALPMCLHERLKPPEECEHQPWGPMLVEAPEGFDRRITLPVQADPFPEPPPPPPDEPVPPDAPAPVEPPAGG